MSTSSDTEPTLAAMQAAAGQARLANHVANHAPGDGPALAGRAGALFGLLGNTEKLAAYLATAAAKLADDPSATYADDGSDPEARAREAAARLESAASLIKAAGTDVGAAWSALIHLGVR